MNRETATEMVMSTVRRMVEKTPMNGGKFEMEFVRFNSESDFQMGSGTSREVSLTFSDDLDAVHKAFAELQRMGRTRKYAVNVSKDGHMVHDSSFVFDKE